MLKDRVPLDRTFFALADPTRRAILTRLERDDGVSVSSVEVARTIRAIAYRVVTPRRFALRSKHLRG